MSKSPDEPTTRKELIELYRLALEEYRFNVSLAWNRTRFYVGLHMALLALTSTLLRIESESRMSFVIIAILGIVTSLLGTGTIRKSHEYYRRSVYKMTLIAEQLGFNRRLNLYCHGLDSLAIASTKSQSGTADILSNTENWLRRKHRFSTITGRLVVLMKVLGWIYGLLFVGTWWPELTSIWCSVQSILPNPTK